MIDELCKTAQEVPETVRSCRKQMEQLSYIAQLLVDIPWPHNPNVVSLLATMQSDTQELKDNLDSITAASKDNAVKRCWKLVGAAAKEKRILRVCANIKIKMDSLALWAICIANKNAAQLSTVGIEVTETLNKVDKVVVELPDIQNMAMNVTTITDHVPVMANPVNRIHQESAGDPVTIWLEKLYVSCPTTIPYQTISNG